MKRKNKQDATLRNVTAAKKREKRLLDRIRALEYKVDTMLIVFSTDSDKKGLKK